MISLLLIVTLFIDNTLSRTCSIANCIHCSTDDTQCWYCDRGYQVFKNKCRRQVKFPLQSQDETFASSLFWTPHNRYYRHWSEECTKPLANNFGCLECKQGFNPRPGDIDEDLCVPDDATPYVADKYIGCRDEKCLQCLPGYHRTVIYDKQFLATIPKDKLRDWFGS